MSKLPSFFPRPNRWTNLEHLETKNGSNKFAASKDSFRLTNNVNIRCRDKKKSYIYITKDLTGLDIFI